MPNPINRSCRQLFVASQVEELETSLDLPLQLVYMKQLTLLREKALQRYKTLAKGSETSEYQVKCAAARRQKRTKQVVSFEAHTATFPRARFCPFVGGEWRAGPSLAHPRGKNTMIGWSRSICAMSRFSSLSSPEIFHVACDT